MEENNEPENKPLIRKSAKPQELRGHSSKSIRDLKKRLPKCWAWIDQVLSPKYRNQGIKKEVVIALIKKALPDSMLLDAEVSARPIVQMPSITKNGIPREYKLGHEIGAE